MREKQPDGSYEDISGFTGVILVSVLIIDSRNQRMKYRIKTCIAFFQTTRCQGKTPLPCDPNSLTQGAFSDSQEIVSQKFSQPIRLRQNNSIWLLHELLPAEALLKFFIPSVFRFYKRRVAPRSYHGKCSLKTSMFLLFPKSHFY